MALKTFGSTSTTALEAVEFYPSAPMTDSDLALMNAAIFPNYGGTVPENAALGTYISRDGQLWIPERGWLRLKAGDWIITDSTTGFPFVLSKNAVADGPYSHS